jgi:hypothetical protein
MQLRFRVFSSRLSAGQRRVYGAATLWFAIVTLAMLWPIYPVFSGIRPMFLGLPLSLAYLAALLTLSFCAGLALYLWEDRHGLLDPADGGEPGTGGEPDRERNAATADRPESR